MNHNEAVYLNLLREILVSGVSKTDRTGVGTRSLFGRTMKFDMDHGFPLLTTKKVFFKGVVAELLWMISGDTNVQTLQDQGVHIWDEWADENGDLGPVYGSQWRAWRAGPGWVIDQLESLLTTIRKKPDSRRMIVSAWNPGELHKMMLPPCHVMYQCYVANARLDLMVYQRSCDMFLGVPFNIASYALLLHMLARETGYLPGTLTWIGGDCHIYNNHFTQVATQLKRDPKMPPTLVLRPGVGFYDYKTDDITLSLYDPHPAIQADVAV